MDIFFLTSVARRRSCRENSPLSHLPQRRTPSIDELSDGDESLGARNMRSYGRPNKQPKTHPKPQNEGEVKQKNKKQNKTKKRAKTARVPVE